MELTMYTLTEKYLHNCNYQVSFYTIEVQHRAKLVSILQPYSTLCNYYTQNSPVHRQSKYSQTVKGLTDSLYLQVTWQHNAYLIDILRFACSVQNIKA